MIEVLIEIEVELDDRSWFYYSMEWGFWEGREKLLSFLGCGGLFIK